MAGQLTPWREHELKLDPPPGFDLQAFLARALEERRFTSIYYDTAAATLTRAGITLRRRVEGRTTKWQLKLPAEDARTEIEAAGGARQPPAALDALLVAHLRVGGPLGEVARLRTRRRFARIDLADGARAEVAHDAVDVLDGRRIVDRFGEVEVELLAGEDGALEGIAKRLELAGAEPAAAVSKVARILPAPAAVDGAVTGAARVRSVLLAQRDALLAHDPGTRFGERPEDLHQMRVAFRRTGACLRGGAQFLPAAWHDEVRTLVREVLGQLGPARDLDVFLAWLRAEAAQLEARDAAALAVSLRTLEARVVPTRDQVRTALDSDAYFAVLDLLSDPPVVEADQTLADIAAGEVERLRRIARKARRGDDELLHRMRLRGKRARYALELAAPELGKRGKPAVAAAKELQDVLGEHQDAVVAEERLRELAAGTHSARTALALGRLVERQHDRRRRARKSLTGAWRRFDQAAARALD